MRALASLEFVSARGLETSDTGPKILANHVNISFLSIFKAKPKFGLKMMKLEKKRTELLVEMDKRRKARQPLDQLRAEFFKVRGQTSLLRSNLSSLGLV